MHCIPSTFTVLFFPGKAGVWFFRWKDCVVDYFCQVMSQQVSGHWLLSGLANAGVCIPFISTAWFLFFLNNRIAQAVLHFKGF